MTDDPHADDYCVVCGNTPEPGGPLMHPIPSIQDGCVCRDCVDGDTDHRFAAYHRDIEARAAQNIDTWGEQDTETLLLAMQEELGELTKAHLEYNWEGGDAYAAPDELRDLMALGVQLHMKFAGAYGDDSA